MRHINEPPPHASERRPEVPPRLDAALQRAMAKEPADRFPSMDAFCNELAACLQELGRRETDGATMVVPARPAPAAPPPSARMPRSRRRSGGAPWAALLLVGLLAAAAVAAAVIAWQRSHDGSGKPTKQVTTAAQVKLKGATAYDPDGSGGEHDAEAPLATDGQAATYWTTERYRSAPSLANKPGVGLVLDAGDTVTLSKLGLATDTPGFVAQIRAGDSATGPFHAVSGSKTVRTQTFFDLTDAKGRYFLVWITKLGTGYPYAHVNEVTAG
jgi:hypothetical protein